MKFCLSIIYIALALVSIKASADQNHLHPVGPCTDDYDKAVLKSLIVEKSPTLWMIVRASFEPEYAIILTKNTELAKTDTDSANQKETTTSYSVVHVIAEEKIWKLKRISKKRAVSYVSPTNSVIRQQIDVSEEFAKQMEDAWLCVLKQTRYPDTPWIGLDGYTVQFYCRGYYGEIWTPTKGLPLALDTLGEKLGELARSSGDEKDRLIKECRVIAKRIIEKANDSNQKLQPTVKTPVESGNAQGIAAEL